MSSSRWVSVLGVLSLWVLALCTAGPLTAQDATQTDSQPAQQMAPQMAPTVGAGLAAQQSAEAQLERLRGVLQAWSLGGSVTQEDVRAVYSAQADPRRSSKSSCIQSVEEDLSTYLEDADPTLLPTLVLWRTQMILGSIQWAEQPTMRSQDFDRLGDRLKTYSRRAARHSPSLSREQAETNVAVVWTGLSEVFARYGSRAFYGLARSALDRALEIDEDLLPARYLHAWVGEKLLPSLDMMRPWRELMEEYPDRAEYRLRFAVNASTAARPVKAIEQLEQVARGDGAEWMRSLAYETWVQLLLDPTKGGSSDHEEAARKLLEEARSELSPWPNLDLLASSLDLRDRRDRALRLAEGVEAHVWPEGEIAPLLRYELPNPDELTDLRAHLIQLMRDGQRRLVAHLQVTDSSEVLRRRSYRACS